jgi:hypothetical protein
MIASLMRQHRGAGDIASLRTISFLPFLRPPPALAACLAAAAGPELCRSGATKADKWPTDTASHRIPLHLARRSRIALY